MATTTTTSIDCEGPCCCRCHACKGIGYWLGWDAVIPACNSFSIQGDGPAVNVSQTIATVLTPIYGSAGGDGSCFSNKLIVYSSDLRSTTTIEFVSPGVATVTYTVSKTDISGGHYQQSTVWTCNSFSCMTGGTFTYTSTTFSGTYNPITTFYTQNDYTGTSVTVSPTSGATWNQCGKNSDGTTYTGLAMARPPLSMMATNSGDGGKVELQLRDKRCDFLGVRTEKKDGCSGWLCGHSCQLGHEAMPGGYCQVCDDYEIDPDFEDVGLAGWLM